MNKLFLTVCIALLLSACNQNKSTSESAETKPGTSSPEVAMNKDMGLKSAMYEAETEMPGGVGSTTMKIIFDDYGKLKLTEMNMNMSVGGHTMNNSTKSLMKDGYVYSWVAGTKTGTKFKLDLSKADPKKDMDFSNLTEEWKAKYHYKDEGTETIDGKECKVGSYEVESFRGKIWMWKQIPVRMELTMSGKSITTNVKNIQENPSIPAGTFDVPSDVEFKEMNIQREAS